LQPGGSFPDLENPVSDPNLESDVTNPYRHTLSTEKDTSGKL
jgi:hypothetical protein